MRLPSKQACSSDAGECREAAGACLQQHNSRGSSWRKLSSQVSIRRDAVHPWLHPTSAATTSQRGGVLTPDLDSSTTQGHGQVASVVKMSASRMCAIA